MSGMGKKRGRRIGTIVILVVLVSLLIGLVLFVRHRMRYAITNAVFVETERLVYLSFPRVNGKILAVTKEEGEKVQTGEILARLDEKPYQAALKTAEARLQAFQRDEAALKIEIDRLEREIALKQAQIQEEMEKIAAKEEALSARMGALSAEIKQLERDRARFKRLVARELAPPRRLEGLETNLEKLRKERKALAFEKKALKEARRALEKELALVANQKKLLREKKEKLKALTAQEEALAAQVENARLHLSYCTLVSPLEGYMAKRFHVAGDVVGPGEPVYALVDPQDLYILVLLEETKLKGVEVGAWAKVKIDAYPDEEFEGEVTEILPATAAKFALVPRDISAGEFTKVAQRVPIKIKITKGPVELLRVGLGGEVEIRRR